MFRSGAHMGKPLESKEVTQALDFLNFENGYKSSFTQKGSLILSDASEKIGNNKVGSSDSYMIKVKGGIYDSSGGGECFKLVIENRGKSQEYKPGFIEELEQYSTALADAKKSTEQLQKEAEKITFNLSKDLS